MSKYIYINSYPRSGSTFVETCLNAMYGDHKGNDILLDTPAKVLHNPELLLENLKNIVQVCIFRDPSESISSFMIKDIGFMLKVPDINDTLRFNKYVESKIDYYWQYVNSAKNNLDNIKAVSFESVKNDTENQLTRISEWAGLNYRGDLKSVISNAKEYLKNNSEYNQFHNSIPVKKPKIYQQYIDYINNVYENEIYLIRNSIQSIF